MTRAKKKSEALKENTGSEKIVSAQQMKVDDGPDSEPSPKKVCQEGDIDQAERDFDQTEGDFVEVTAMGSKKNLKKKKVKKANPKFWLRDQGEKAALIVDLDSRIPLFVVDIQHLIMYSEIGPHTSYYPTRWCQVERHNSIKHTNVLVIENLSLYHFISNESRMPFLCETFRNKIEIVNPSIYGSDLVKDLINVPLTLTQMRKFASKYGTLENAVEQSKDVFDLTHSMFPIASECDDNQRKRFTADKFPRTQLLLSGWQLVEENYPLPIKGLMERKYKGYVLSKDQYSHVTVKSPMFGIDCEMCKTREGSELARVTVVNEKYLTIYDEIVRPKNKIVDYMTQWSGITPSLMATSKKNIDDVHEDLQKLFPQDAIWVGQGLCNDLHALKMFHPYIIDSSVCFNTSGYRGRKTRLQVLAREFLNERIQTGIGGHDSAEDAIASLKLIHLKLQKDLYYGDAVMTTVEYQMKKHPQFGSSHFATSMLKQATRTERTASVTALPSTLEHYREFTFKRSREKYDKKVHFRNGDNNDDVISKFCENMHKFTLNVAHVEIKGDSTGIEKVFTSVDGWVKRMYESGPAPTMNIVIFGGFGKEANGCCFIDMKQLT